MSTANFTPEVWAREIHLAQRRETILNGVVNRNYEGEIANQGDTVHINGLDDLTIKDYDRTAGLGTPERLNTNRRTLVIDQAKAFDALYDDIEKVQNSPELLGQAASTAGTQLVEVAEDFVFGRMVAGAGRKGSVEIAAPGDVYDKLILPAATVLKRANCARSGRFAVLGPELEELLQRDDRVIKGGSEAADARFVNGVIGRVGGITLLSSNASVFADDAVRDEDGEVTTPATTYGKVIVGHMSATTVADQIVKTRAMESENWFGTRVSGLHVYGAKVVRPENLVAWTTTVPV